MTGALLRALWALLKGIPPQVYAILAGLVILGYAAWWLESRGAEKERAKWVPIVQGYKDAERDREAKIAALEKARQETAEKVRVEYVERVKVVHEKGEEVIREVEKLVPVVLLPGAFRMLHDSAVAGELPDDPGGAAAAAAPVTAVTALQTIAGNYDSCRQNTEKLLALQALLKEMPRE